MNDRMNKLFIDDEKKVVYIRQCSTMFDTNRQYKTRKMFGDDEKKVYNNSVD